MLNIYSSIISPGIISAFSHPLVENQIEITDDWTSDGGWWRLEGRGANL